MIIWIKFTHSGPFCPLILKILVFSLTIFCLTTFHLPWFLDLPFSVSPSIPTIACCSLQHWTSISSHIHNCTLFLLWLCLFILPGVISPPFSSSLLGIYHPGEFIFQCPIFLPLHTVHGVLKARILKQFAIPFSSGPHSARSLHHDLSILGGPTWHGLVSLS